MTLDQYIKITQIDNPIEQLKILGCPADISVGKSKELINKKLSFNYEPKLIKKFKVGGRTFKLLNDIEDMVAVEYAFFKQVVGEVYSNQVDEEDQVIEVSDEEKYKKLFIHAHKIIAVFTKETTLLKRKLKFIAKSELIKHMDIQQAINILFFYLNVIRILERNGTIYYMERMKEKEI